MAAGFAERERRVAAAVEKEQGLAAVGEGEPAVTLFR